MNAWLWVVSIFDVVLHRTRVQCKIQCMVGLTCHWYVLGEYFDILLRKSLILPSSIPRTMKALFNYCLYSHILGNKLLISTSLFTPPPPPPPPPPIVSNFSVRNISHLQTKITMNSFELRLYLIGIVVACKRSCVELMQKLVHPKIQGPVLLTKIT